MGSCGGGGDDYGDVIINRAAPITTTRHIEVIVANVVLSSLLTMNQTMHVILFNGISDSYRLFGSGEWKGRKVLTESGNTTSRGNLLCTPGTGTPGWCKYCVVWNWRTSKSGRLICCPIASSGEGQHVASKANRICDQHLISSRRFSCSFFGHYKTKCIQFILCMIQ